MGEGPVAVTWVDTARLREVSGLSGSAEEALGDERWSLPVGLALSEDLATNFVSTDYGFDPMAGDRTVSVGAPPDDATRYDGVDTDGAAAAFEEFGFEASGEFLAIGEEGEVVTDAIDRFANGPIGTNRVAVDGESIALGAFEEPVAAALGRSGEPVADVEGMAAMDECLGPDAFAATVRDPEEAAAEEVALSGTAIAGASDDAVTELVCAVGAPDESLDAIADCVESSFNEGGIDYATNQSFEGLLGTAEIETGDLDGAEWVRATFSPDGEVGAVFEIDQQSGLAGPLGGAAAAAVGPAATPEQIEAVEAEGSC